MLSSSSSTTTFFALAFAFPAALLDDAFALTSFFFAASFFAATTATLALLRPRGAEGLRLAELALSTDARLNGFFSQRLHVHCGLHRSL
ncbi:hypothetical protein B0H17DRAFT_1061064 [Mycena rosella]|uniref:Uncharacterized protein n=1 Tax=Mycena rosella TaxID=1033263 RepID=A0AAD7DK17_MYCRO|nr:hypothetical protein B0H17DRAFT_1061064 [Mycena rosella]